MIMSVEQTRGRVDCGRQGVSQDVSAGAVPRPTDLRHQQSGAARSGRTGSDLPRLAHPFGRVRARQGRLDHRLRLRNIVRPEGAGAPGLRRRSRRRRPHGPVPHRRRRDPQPRTQLERGSSTARRSSRTRRRAISRVFSGATTTKTRPTRPRGPTSATTSPSSRAASSRREPARATGSSSTFRTRGSPSASTR